MDRRRFRTVKAVVDWRLCLGCGACAYVCPERKIDLVDVLSQGIRPVVVDEQCGSCNDCLRVCPSFDNDHRPLLQGPGLIEGLKSAYGPVLEIWEGHATDAQIRWMGSSGGLLTALSLFCIEQAGMHGVLHIGADRQDPARNRTRLSRTRDDLLDATGSRYAPASACDSLDLIEGADGPCVFIGQPSEVTALRKAEALRPALKEKVGVALSFFCAGSPSTSGTLELLRAEGIAVDDVAELRYRGMGWPGSFAVRRRGEKDFAPLQSYGASWAFLQRFRPLSVNLTPDGSGEDADISCGDPWYRPIEAGESGSSLVLVRTARGSDLLRRARDAGYIELVERDVSVALRSQVNLVRKRGAVGGRIAALRLAALPAPRLRGFSLVGNWMRLTLLEKLQSTLGTARRIVTRRLRHPLRIDAEDVAPCAASDRRPMTVDSASSAEHGKVRGKAIANLG